MLSYYEKMEKEQKLDQFSIVNQICTPANARKTKPKNVLTILKVVSIRCHDSQ